MRKILVIFFILIITKVAHSQNCLSAFSHSNVPGTSQIMFYDSSFAMGQIVTHFWNFGDGQIDTVPNPIHTYNTLGTFSVCHTIIAQNPQCAHTTCDTVNISILGNYCVADFSFQNMGNMVVDFTNLSSVNTNQWLWDFGDLTSSTLKNPTHTYQSGGIYNVCLIATDLNNACYDTICKQVIIANSNCLSSYTYTVNQLYNGTVNFYGNTLNQNIVAWHWDFGNGDTSNIQNPVYQFNNLQTQTVCLTITDYTGCTSTLCDTIHLQAPVTCNALFTSVVNQSTVFFNNISTTDTGDAIISCLWTFGNNTTSGSFNPTVNYTAPGTYTVCLTIITANNCVNTFCNFVVIQPNPPCQPFFTFTDNGGGVVTFHNLSIVPPYSSYNWTFGDNTSDTAANPTHTYFGPGPWVVCLSVGAQGCQATYCDTVLLSALTCQSYYSKTADTANTLLFHFNDYSIGQVVTWNWDFGDFTTSALQHPSHLYAQGSYNVCLDITTANGCTSNYCSSVSAVSSSCLQPFTYVQDTISGLFTFNLDTINCNIQSIIWNFGDTTYGSGTSPQHMYTDTGWYNVCVTLQINNQFYTICENIYAKILNSTNVFNSTYVNDINVFPNPTNDGLVTVEIPWLLNELVQIELFDIQGALLWNEQKYLNGSKTILNIDRLSNGLYTLKITADRKLYMKRVHHMKTN